MTPRYFPQIDRCWLLFFPNDLRCGFRKLKEQGGGNRASGAVLVPKSLLLLLGVRPHVRHRVPSLLGEEQHENDVRFLTLLDVRQCCLMFFEFP